MSEMSYAYYAWLGRWLTGALGLEALVKDVAAFQQSLVPTPRLYRVGRDDDFARSYRGSPALIYRIMAAE